MSATDTLRYPIGPMPVLDAPATGQQRAEWIDAIERLPARLRSAVGHFTPPQWDTPYRPGGWTVRQLVHHLADSHLNAYVRFKLALTEDEPTIKPYDEAAWVASYRRTLRHPEHGRVFMLDDLLAQYAWHCDHHTRHITALCEREAWTSPAG